GSTRRRSTRPYGPSTSFWRDGPIGSSSPCAGTRRGPSTGCNASRAARPACSLIGPCSLDAAEQWEPYDARVSRTVVCPAKAGMFSRRKACRGKSQKPRSLDSRVAGNQDPEAYRQRLPRGDDESPGRNDSERESGLESE